MSPRSDNDVERFDRWAATYDKSWLQSWYFDPIHSAMLHRMEDGLIDTPGSLLDVGCGTGRLLRKAADHWPSARLVGVDPAERMIGEAKRLTPTADLHVAPAEALPLADSSVDLVFTSLSFHHWEDQRRGLQEITRVLTPGGRMCLADHTLPGVRWFKPSVRSLAELRSLMEGAGLVVSGHRRMWTRFVVIVLARKEKIRRSLVTSCQVKAWPGMGSQTLRHGRGDRG